MDQCTNRTGMFRNRRRVGVDMDCRGQPDEKHQHDAAQHTQAASA